MWRVSGIGSRRVWSPTPLSCSKRRAGFGSSSSCRRSNNGRSSRHLTPSTEHLALLSSIPAAFVVPHTQPAPVHLLPRGDGGGDGVDSVVYPRPHHFAGIASSGGEPSGSRGHTGYARVEGIDPHDGRIDHPCVCHHSHSALVEVQFAPAIRARG